MSVCHCTPPLSPIYGNSGDNDFSSITALLKVLHCGDLLRVTTLLFIIINSKEVYICVISQARHCGGARKVTAQHISQENGPISWTERNTVMKFCIYLDIDKMQPKRLSNIIWDWSRFCRGSNSEESEPGPISWTFWYILLKFCIHMLLTRVGRLIAKCHSSSHPRDYQMSFGIGRGFA